MPRIAIKGPPGSGKIDLIVKGLQSAGTPVQIFICDQMDPDTAVFKSKKKGMAFILDNFDRLSESNQDSLLRKIRKQNSSNLVFTVETEM
jgi:hypothetical protein